MRNLRLTTPYMTGDDVKTLQRQLAGANSWKQNFQPGAADGVYGLMTAEAVKRAKTYLGFPTRAINTAAGTTFQAILSGQRALPADYEKRRQERAGTMRNLYLTSPYTKGKDVEKLQKWLAGDNVFKKNFRPGKIDGVYGPGTAGAISRAKWWMGYPAKQCGGNAVASTFYNLLTGKTKLPLLYAVRHRQRKAAAEAAAAQTKMRVQALELARKQVGIKESPAGSNRVKFSEWYGIIGPWCAMFTTWCYVQVGSKVHKRGSQWAYVPYLLAATTRAGSGVTQTADPQPGDLVLFDWDRDGVPDHIGFFDKWTDRAAGVFATIEGNTSSTNNSNGGRVEARSRKRNQVRAFVKVHG